MWEYNYSDELCHHGIKGQRWGVRRYQNEDGSLTSAGKQRYDSEDRSERNKKITRGIAIGASVVGTAALGAYALKNPKAREYLSNISSLAKGKTKEFMKSQGKTLIKNLGDSASKTGKSMCDAAVASVGTITVAKLAKKLETKDTDSQTTKDINKILFDTASAGINAATQKGNASSNNGKKNTNDLLKKTRDLKEQVGAPKGIFGAEGEKAYQELFKKNPTDEQRGLIKAMRKNGYSADQIEKYVYHSDICLDSTFASYDSVLIGKVYVAGIL